MRRYAKKESLKRMANKKKFVVQRVLGTLYVMSGISKFFPQLESVKNVLDKASMANEHNLLAIPSLWMSEHSTIITWFLGFAMILAGIILIVNRFWVKLIIYGTLFMMVCFMTFLHRSQPMVFALDFPFVIASIYLLLKQKRLATEI